MTSKLKLSAVPDERPVKLTVELPAPVFRNLQIYARLLADATPDVSAPPDPARLIAPMVARFMATDKAFRKLRNELPRPEGRGSAIPDRSPS